MALIDPPLYLQADAHPARSFRAVITEMWDEGVMSLADFAVAQRSAGGANFSVDVSAGRAVVQGDSAVQQGCYMVTNDATVNDATTLVTSAPSAGNTRYDIVVLEIKDNAEDAGGINAPRFRVIAGTPASSGAVPPAVPNSCLLLATIGPIVNGTGSITNSLITDSRRFAGRRCTPGTLELMARRVGDVNGWLWCDGTAVSRTTYARLFAHVGTTYGVGNGSTTFNLPDLRGRMPLAWDNTKGEGVTGGAETHTLALSEIPSHNHGGLTGGQSVSHTHPYNDPVAGAVIGGPAGGGSLFYGILYPTPSASGAASNDHAHGISSQGSGAAHNNMPPYQVVSGWMIRT